MLAQRAFGRRSAESGAGVEARIDRLEGLIEKLLDHIERGDE